MGNNRKGQKCFNRVRQHGQVADSLDKFFKTKGFKPTFNFKMKKKKAAK